VRNDSTLLKKQRGCRHRQGSFAALAVRIGSRNVTAIASFVEPNSGQPREREDLLKELPRLSAPVRPLATMNKRSSKRSLAQLSTC